MGKRIYTEEEARERKNARQREYSKRTGYAAQNKHNTENYTQLVIRLKNDVASAYKEKCKQDGIPYSQPMIDAIKKYLENS